jgi:hypothetical protein
MDQRIGYGKLAPEEVRTVGGLETYLRSTSRRPRRQSRKGAMT